jgi:hypothetical protein
MYTKILFLTLVIATAIAATTATTTVTGHARADTVIQYKPVNHDGYYTHVGSHIVFVDSGKCPCGDAPGAGYACNNCNSFTQQPHVQMVALTDNCFWSYPVQCN